MMAAPVSLRSRLLAGTIAWIVLTLLVAGGVLSGLFDAHVTSRFEAELRLHLNQLASSVESGADGTPVLIAELSDPRMRTPYAGLYWQVDRIGPPATAGALRSRSLWDATLKVPGADPPAGAVGVGRGIGPQDEAILLAYRVVRGAGVGAAPLRLIVAADRRDMNDAVRDFRRVLILSLATLAAGLIAAAVAQVVTGLAPLRRLQGDLQRVRDGESPRLEGRHPLEVQPLVDDFNKVLERNARMVERARAQAGNLAHGIKTPLAILANATASEAGRDALAGVVTEQVGQLRRHIDWHLSRARVAASRDLPGQSVSVGPVIEGLVRVMRRVHAGRELAIDIDRIAPDLAFAGEEQDLQEMLGNLLDNACKWARSRVRIGARGDAGQLVIEIEDDGDGIAPERMANALQRGVRLDERVPGSGLGLAITNDLAMLYEGTATLGAAGGGGLLARLDLPRA